MISSMSLTTLPTDHVLAWAIIILATLGVIARPFHWPEAIWAVAGAALLVLLRLLPVDDAIAGMRKGVDVYLFLTGMMLIAELARREGFFDWLAALAVEHARGSPQRLFLLVYAVGTLVTAFLSNDATAIVLTPAVYAASRAAGATPLPYLFVCAFIANAASFVLPISNPANLVVYGAHMPHLLDWLRQFALPSAAVRRRHLHRAARGAAPRTRRGASRTQGAAPGVELRRKVDGVGHRRDRRRAGRRPRRSTCRWDCRLSCAASSRRARCWRWLGSRPGRSSRTSPGACCRWSPACS